MRIFTDHAGLPADAQGAVLAIGNFDGLHPGHRAVLSRAYEVAGRRGAPFGVLTFEPHPRQYFQPGIAPFRLTPAPMKRWLIRSSGAALYYELPFDAGMAARTAEDFILDVLIGGIGARHIVVGDGFAFGKGRAGTVSVLNHVAGHRGIGVTAVAQIMAGDGAPCSSTRIRDMLRRGDVRGANALLGRRWAIEGTVDPGDRRGRLLGFPTANIDLGQHLRPAFGVYAVRARPADDGAGGSWNGVANLGLRPTIGDGKVLLEVHLFDFAGDLYGRRLSVDLVDYLRPEQKFAGLDALKAQIAEDSARARDILSAAKA